MSDRSNAQGSESPVSTVTHLACDLPLEHGRAVAHNSLEIGGWAYSPGGVAGVIVQIDDRILHASYGLDSPWLEESGFDDPAAAHAAFRLEIDTSDWDRGTRRVVVAAYDRAGSREEIAGEVEVIPFGEPAYTVEARRREIEAGRPVLVLDQPTWSGKGELAEPVQVAGWAFATAGIEAVTVTIDGRIRHDAHHPIFRPDLLDEYGEQVAGRAGFVLDIHPRDCPPGWHRLGVVAIAPDGAVGIETDFLCLAAPEESEAPGPDGALAVDWLDERRRPALREPDAGEDGELTHWRDRALLAEADAAASRNERNLAVMHQQATLRMADDARRQLDATADRLHAAATELAAARDRLGDRDADVESLTGEVDRLTAQLAETVELSERRAATVAAYERSLSWRLTRPLRAVRRAARHLRPGRRAG